MIIPTCSSALITPDEARGAKEGPAVAPVFSENLASHVERGSDGDTPVASVVLWTVDEPRRPVSPCATAS